MKKIKILIAIILTIITIIIFLSLCPIEKNIKTIRVGNMDKSNAGDILVNGSKGYISSAEIIQRKTGTGPFDGNDNPGNDIAEDNNIVRSFDQVTWTMDVTMKLKEGVSEESMKGGVIKLEVTLPEECENVMEWDLDSMKWLEGTGSVSENGRKLTGSYTMSQKDITVPGKQTLIFVVGVKGAKNNTQIKPTFSLWLDGNEESDKKQIIDSEVKVSAAPKYNVELKRNTGLAKEITYDENGVTNRGRLYGYGLTFQLYNNENTSKGIKGIEYPQGDINLDINLKLQKSSVSNPSNIQDITNTTTPILYNYKMNSYDNYSGFIPNREMNVTFHAAHLWQAPGSTRGKTTDKLALDRYNYDSGRVYMSQTGNNIKLTLKNYQFDGIFPRHFVGDDSTDTYINYGNNIGCFSTSYFQVFIPFTEETKEPGYNYYLTVNDTNFNATSIGGTITNKQEITTDDSSTSQHVLFQGGSFGVYHWLTRSFNGSYSGSEGLYSHYGLGDAKAAIGQKFVVRHDITTGANNDIDKDIYDLNQLIKFDGNAFNVTSIDGKSWEALNIYATNCVQLNDMKFKMIYAAKPDGTNWISDTEMNNAEEENLVFFETQEELKSKLGQNAYCVGVLFESISGKIGFSSGSAPQVALEVTKNAKLGEVYQFVSTARIYHQTNKLNRSTQTRTNPDAVFTKYDLQIKNNYLKTAYDENGNIVPGTHSGSYSYGQSVQIIGGNVTISSEVIDTKSDGGVKTNYDIGRNELEVTYKLSPQLKPEGDNKTPIKDITVKVEETLPQGLSYILGSSDYGEPTISQNADETTTLIWNIYGCTMGEGITPITFKAKINEETKNGVQYKTTAVVSADKIGKSLPSIRTSYTSIQITNLSSHRLYKIAKTPVIEKNGQILFKISYENKTDNPISDFQLLDILPYIGDNRGTKFSGTYILNKIDINQIIDGVSSLNSNLKLYTSLDESVKSLTAKDDKIGISNIWNIKNIGEAINEQVKGFALKGTIPGRTKVDIDVYLNTSNNLAQDIYQNNTMAQVYSNSEQMETAIVKAQVVNRILEGKVWEDLNRNDILDNGEIGKNDITVKLINSNDNTVLKTTKTLADGTYKFQDLQKGNYKVQIEYDEFHELAEKNVGTNIEINSKFDKNTKITDEITRLNSIQTPIIRENNVNAGLRKIQFNVVTEVEGEGGSITGQDTPTYESVNKGENSKKDIIITPNYGYRVIKITVNNEEIRFTEETEHKVNLSKFTNMQENKKIIVKFQKISAKVTVHHYIQNTTTKLSNDIHLEGYVSDEYETALALDIPTYYELVEMPSNYKGNMTEEEITIIYYYKLKKYTYTVEYYYDNILNSEKTEKYSKTYNEEINTYTDKAGYGYKLEKTENLPLRISENELNNVIKIYYVRKDAQVIVKYLEKNTNKELQKQELINGKVFDKYETIKKDIPYFTCVEDTNNTNGEMTEEQITVTYYYLQNTSAKVEYIDIITGKILEEKTQDGLEGDVFETETKEFVGYVLKQEPEQKTINMQKEKITLKYYYVHISAGVIENHIDMVTDKKIPEIITKEDGTIEKVDSTRKYEGNEGDIYKTSSKQFDGYDLIQKDNEGNNKLPQNAEGKMEINQITVNYYYKRKAKVIVKYIDEVSGKEIVKNDIIEGHELDEYKTKPQTLKGYELISRDNEGENKLPENADGNMKVKVIVNENEQEEVDNITEVIYYYKRPAKVEISYIDIDTNEEIANKEYINGYENDKYETNAKDIKFYKLEKDANNKKGNMKVDIKNNKVNDTIIIKYYYKKLKFNLELEKNITEITVNGETKEVQDGKLGKIEIYRKSLETTNIKVKYSIIVKNTGELTGNTKIVEDIPDGFEMKYEDNTDWKQFNGKAVKQSKDIAPGEKEEIEVILTWTKGEKNIGLKNNVAKLEGITNEANFKEESQKDNLDKASLLLTISTGDGTNMIVILEIILLLPVAGIGYFLGRSRNK